MLQLGRKAMCYPGEKLCATGLLVKATVFPVFMYGCESWTIKKAERQRIDAFELRYWRRLLRVPWTARRSNQSILKEISPEAEAPGLCHLMRRTDSLEKTLMLGKTEGGRRRGWQRMRWLDGIIGHEFEWTPGVGDGQGGLACCSPWGHKESDMTVRLNWTELMQSSKDKQHVRISESRAPSHTYWTRICTLTAPPNILCGCY